MEAVMPRQALIGLIEPHFPKESKIGDRSPYPIATMLRSHLLLGWYPLSDPAMEEALIEVPPCADCWNRADQRPDPAGPRRHDTPDHPGQDLRSGRHRPAGRTLEHLGLGQTRRLVVPARL